ncbi:PIN domain nuclease [Abyssibacter profundi]|uniref:PIN domain nuclease n=2 Tax=Abyssibacter profundi TaxID=2182787 RepID=A0A383XQ02_9GAMM|nr:PIN domain nuclease [Abyssibacter profundi]
MAFMLDTHTFLWWLADDSRLPTGVRDRIKAPENQVFVSAATGWEISIKKALGKLEAPDEIASLLDEEGFQEMPISFVHGQMAGHLPSIHRDPFDRMLVAQCQAHGLTLLTRDENIPRYEVATFWA